MTRKILGFLNIKGWGGVVEVGILAILGSLIGVSLIYFFFYYRKEPKPKRVSLKLLIFEAIFLIAILILLIVI